MLALLGHSLETDTCDAFLEVLHYFDISFSV